MCCLLAACSGGGQSSPDFQRGMMQRQDLMSALEVLSSHPDDLMANRVVWGFYTERGEYDSVIMFAGKMFSEKSGQAGYERLWLYSGAFASQTCVLGDSFDSAAYYLDRIIPFAGSGDSDDFLDAMIHNTAALYSLKTEMDYSAALEHYKAACASLEHSGNMVGLSTMLCNIASIYYVMRDSSGFEYAEQAYRISHDSQYGTRAYMVALSSLALAQMYSLKGDYGQAMSFVDKASGEIHEFPQFVPSLYLLYAEIYAAQGIDTQAEHYYEEAVAHEDDAEPSDRVLISLRYAEFLSVRGRNAEARGCLLHGLEISRSVSSMEYRSDLLTALADVSVKLGDDASRILSDASSEIQLQDLAMEMGYNSQSSFYRAFVKETGVPPSKYREESLRIKAAC